MTPTLTVSDALALSLLTEANYGLLVPTSDILGNDSIKNALHYVVVNDPRITELRNYGIMKLR